MHVTPLSDVLGVRISGVDISQPLPIETARALGAALDEHQVVVLPKQKLSTESFVRFSRHFGPAEPHVIDTFHHRKNADRKSVV